MVAEGPSEGNELSVTCVCIHHEIRGSVFDTRRAHLACCAHCSGMDRVQVAIYGMADSGSIKVPGQSLLSVV